MGYPLDLFIDEDINQEFICTICNDVLKNPTLIDVCEHTFCDSCIRPWNESAGTCPLDRRDIGALTRPQRPFMNVLNSLRMHCAFKNLGCNQTVKLGDILDHDQRCEFNPDNRKECGGGCGAVLNQAEAGKHNCVAYLLEKLEVKEEEIERLKEQLAQRGPTPNTLPPPTVECTRKVNISVQLAVQFKGVVQAEFQRNLPRDGVGCRLVAEKILLALGRLPGDEVRRFMWVTMVRFPSNGEYISGKSCGWDTQRVHNVLHIHRVAVADALFAVNNVHVRIRGVPIAQDRD